MEGITLLLQINTGTTYNYSTTLYIHEQASTKCDRACKNRECGHKLHVTSHILVLG